MIARILPNLFTLGNLFIGILALIFAFQGDWAYAAIMVIIGMFLDGLDGRVARMMKTESDFGKELDSLSDIISFGVAPAFIMYVVVLQDVGIYGWLVSALFPACGALRLARFNVRPGVPGFFVGLPITAAGGILATMALYHSYVSSFVLIVGMIGLSLLMVSSVKYPNFKKVGVSRAKATYWIAPLVVVIAALSATLFPQYLPHVFFIPLAFYALYGVKQSIARYIRRYKRKKKEEQFDPK